MTSNQCVNAASCRRCDVAKTVGIDGCPIRCALIHLSHTGLSHLKCPLLSLEGLVARGLSNGPGFDSR